MPTRLRTSHTSLPGISALVDLATDHLVDQLQARQVGRHVFTFQLAVAQDRNAVRDRVGLIKEVRDKENRDALGLELTQCVEQASNLVFVQTGRRLVEDQDLPFVTKRARNRHHLLDRDRITRQGQRHVNRNVEHLEGDSCTFVHRRPIDDRTAHRETPDENVLCHRQIRAEIDFLINRTDAEILCLQHRSGLNLRAAEADIAAVRRFDAGQHLDQRRLSRPVLPHKGMNLPRKESDSDVLERNDTWKPLVDALHLEDWLFRHGY